MQKSEKKTDWHRHQWGVSTFLYVGAHSSLAIACGKANGASSLHFHAEKHNAFLVQEGIIEIWGKGQIFLARVGPQEAYVSPAGEVHRMVFLTDATLYEFYRTKDGQILRLDDIARIEDGWVPGAKKVLSRAPATQDSAGNPCQAVW